MTDNTSAKLMNIPFSPPDISEREIEEVTDTLRSGWITTGAKTKKLENLLQAYTGAKGCVCLSSQTACAEMALRLLGIGPGDEVITTAYTYTASASVIAHVGAKIVLIDCQKDSLEMDYDALEKAVNERTKAIIPVDIAGIPCDYDRITAIAEGSRRFFKAANKLQALIGRVAILEDAAHAVGATYKGRALGSFADFTGFSFHAVKNFTTAEGGALCWNIPGADDKEIYHKLQLFSLHGQDKDALAKNKLGAWEYDIEGLWYKCNMTDIQASLGIAQFERYPALLERRKAIIETYDRAFKPLGIEVLSHYTADRSSSGHLYITRIPGIGTEQRQAIMDRMTAAGIATNVHYKPLPMHTAYKELGFSIEDYPNAYAHFANEITLPLYTLLTDEQIRYICEKYSAAVREFLPQNAAAPAAGEEKKTGPARLAKKLYLASPTMHGDELRYMAEAYSTNWMSTVGANINEVEKIAAEKAEMKYAVALSSCTAALHLCCKLAGEKLYGKPQISHGALEGRRVFCSDMTFDATLNPVVYEGGIPIFIDTEAASWNMDPVALEKAFALYPEVRLVVCAELYGFPGRIDLIKEICEKHGALLIEDAAEAMGATLNGRQCGSFGDYSAISYNGNKIITGSSGGCLLTNSLEDANKARKWSTQARENAPWYQHEEVGYNYRMSNVVAGVVRGQYPYLLQHIAQKKAIYERYAEGLKDLPVKMNPITAGTEPNYWLSALIIDETAMCRQVRDDSSAIYVKEPGKSCPTEILEKIAAINAEGRPIWKPMHMQPMYRMHEAIGRDGTLRCRTNAYIAGGAADVGADVFRRGLCLPSDNKMTEKEQAAVIAAIRECFR